MKNILSFKLFEEVTNPEIEYTLFIKSDFAKFLKLIEAHKAAGYKFKWDILNKKIWDKILNDRLFLLVDTKAEDKNYRFVGIVLEKNLLLAKTKSLFLSFYNCNHYCTAEKVYSEMWSDFTVLDVLDEKGYKGDLENIEGKSLFDALNSLYTILKGKQVEEIMKLLQTTSKEYLQKVHEFFKSLDGREQKFSQLAEKSPAFYNYMLEALEEEEVFKAKLNKDMGDLGF